MSAPLDRRTRLVVVGFLAIVGGLVGLLAGHNLRLAGQPPRPDVREYPLPHHIAKYEGGVTLRFAMVHDVIHERYPRHGEAYYQERNRLAREGLKDKQPGEDYFALCDDLGAGLDFLKQDDEAVSLLRDKLRQQEALGLTGRQLYTTYANLGTFLIHGSARAALSGDAAARERLREGLSFIHKSIEVNPEAHFGREVWQAVAVEFLLAVSDRPNLLQRYDMIGDRLDEEIDPTKLRSFTPMYGRHGASQDVAAYLRDKNADLRSGGPASLRDLCITPVGAGTGWAKAVASSHRQAVPSSHLQSVPFDEPTLGIVGMWRLGGGASPHFALALGEIMLRVGQRYVAWCAYERAAGLAVRAWHDADVQRQFVAHCRRRKHVIELELPADEEAGLRPRFEAELAHGQRYQKEYQEYEADRIRAGTSLDDPHFYDDFNATHPPIASPVGEEEKFVVERGKSLPYFNWPVAVFAAGVSAWLGVGLVRVLGSRLRAGGS